ncbi:MAG TPA: nucleotidyl transferase AbiEii/AbiGii toxin family protein [Kofleriaceae bacterium]|jgi:predicted nucleotidyltransferase|nr:nucleotidyl transferase AbiEii/AbiGii toxin family protein [Kofleriaceae bacterium]
MIPDIARADLREFVVGTDRDVVLLGAAALRIANPRFLRRITDDLDLTVAVDVSDLPSIVPRTWRPHPSFSHRWFGTNGTKFDLVPSSRTILESGVIHWPDGYEMNAAGLDLALRHHQPTPLALGDGAEVNVASVPSIIVLKMVAYLDRPGAREKDLGDLAHTIALYVDDDDDRRFTDEVFEQQLAFEDAAPFLAGQDVASICETRHRDQVARFLDRLSREGVEISLMRRDGPDAWARDGAAERGMDAFRRGFA